MLSSVDGRQLYNTSIGRSTTPHWLCFINPQYNISSEPMMLCFQEDIKRVSNKQLKMQNKRPHAKCARRVKCQYVVNMSITSMLKKAIRGDDKFLPPTPIPPFKALPCVLQKARCTSKHFKTYIIKVSYIH